MSDNCLLHASLVAFDDYGVLLQGKSGYGKSDLALRLIENKGAVLVADDVVFMEKKEQKLSGKAPQNIAGKLEIRGVGIVDYPYKKEVEPVLNINLVNSADKVERMPKERTTCILGLEIPQIDLYAKENSAPDKVVAVLRCIKKQQRERRL
ncbi:MAG: HPr kinase/phosphatase C-terminal domain-containing protein [Alphaproteobacteria bacterium]|nr:HPr kinase/phosphatase C-terminal domain-containing protein [Alphaproteobacteria bacterium]